ncbi:MAG: hypothetical protein L6E13_08755 [Firmicutes bacterium]|nr:hypothetical protein [Bacillota bacterium]
MAGTQAPYLQPGTLVENTADVMQTSGRRFATGELRGTVLTCYRDPAGNGFRCRVLTETGDLALCSTQDLRVVPWDQPAGDSEEA